MTTSEPTTVILLQRVKQGDGDALNELYRRYVPRVLAAVRLRLGAELRQRVDSWDILQDVLLESLKQIESFDPKNEGALLNWLGKIALHRIRDANDFHHAQRRDMRREQSLKKKGIEKDSTRIFPVADIPSPSELLMLSENVEQLEQALEGLDDDEREIIIARKIEEQSFADIGQSLGVTADAARMRYNRTMAQLVQAFQELDGKMEEC